MLVKYAQHTTYDLHFIYCWVPPNLLTELVSESINLIKRIDPESRLRTNAIIVGFHPTYKLHYFHVIARNERSK